MSPRECADCGGCPNCGELLTESMCGKRLECLHCGAVFVRETKAQELERYAYEHHPWEHYGVYDEDPDERPYIWDLPEEEQCP